MIAVPEVVIERIAAGRLQLAHVVHVTDGNVRHLPDAIGIGGEVAERMRVVGGVLAARVDAEPCVRQAVARVAIGDGRRGG